MITNIYYNIVLTYNIMKFEAINKNDNIEDLIEHFAKRLVDCRLERAKEDILYSFCQKFKYPSYEAIEYEIDILIDKEEHDYIKAQYCHMQAYYTESIHEVCETIWLNGFHTHHMKTLLRVVHDKVGIKPFTSIYNVMMYYTPLYMISDLGSVAENLLFDSFKCVSDWDEHNLFDYPEPVNKYYINYLYMRSTNICEFNEAKTALNDDFNDKLTTLDIELDTMCERLSDDSVTLDLFIKANEKTDVDVSELIHLRDGITTMLGELSRAYENRKDIMEDKYSESINKLRNEYRSRRACISGLYRCGLKFDDDNASDNNESDYSDDEGSCPCGGLNSDSDDDNASDNNEPESDSDDEGTCPCDGCNSYINDE